MSRLAEENERLMRKYLACFQLSADEIRTLFSRRLLTTEEQRLITGDGLHFSRNVL